MIFHSPHYRVRLSPANSPPCEITWVGFCFTGARLSLSSKPIPLSLSVAQTHIFVPHKLAQSYSRLPCQSWYITKRCLFGLQTWPAAPWILPHTAAKRPGTFFCYLYMNTSIPTDRLIGLLHFRLQKITETKRSKHVLHFLKRISSIKTHNILKEKVNSKKSFSSNCWQKRYFPTIIAQERDTCHVSHNHQSWKNKKWRYIIILPNKNCNSSLRHFPP